MGSGRWAAGWTGMGSLLVTLNGCESPLPVLCPGAVTPGIVVEVLDSSTGAWIADSASGVVRDGEYVDSLRPHTWSATYVLATLQAAGDRPGTYRVEVSRPRYEDWSQDGVVAEPAPCVVATTTIVARLRPTP